MLSQEFVLLLELSLEVGAVVLEDELGFVSVKKKPFLQEEHLQLASLVRESILKFWGDKNSLKKPELSGNIRGKFTFPYPRE